MTKVLRLFVISMLFCFLSKADLFDVYDLDQLRTVVPTYIQTIIARYILASINTDFIVKLPKKFEWRWATTRKIEQPIAHFLGQRPFTKKSYQEIVSPTKYEKKFYLEKPRNFPYKLIVQYQEQPLVYKPKFTLEYPEETVFTFYWLEPTTMNIHVIVGNEEHIWQAYITVNNKEYTWQESVNIENYVPHNTVTLEQVLFLMLINFVYTARGNVDLAYVAYAGKDTLSKHLPTNSLQAIVGYLYTILKSFGPTLESLITRHFYIKNSSLHTVEDYELLFQAKKQSKHCVSQ